MKKEIQARQRKDLIDGMVAIPHLENSKFAVVKKWHNAKEAIEGCYKLYDRTTKKYVGTFASIDLEFKK